MNQQNMNVRAALIHVISGEIIHNSNTFQYNAWHFQILFNLVEFFSQLS